MKKKLLSNRKTYGVLVFLFFSFYYSLFHAQTAPICTGTWGPPIVNQNFGQGNATANWYGPLASYAPGVSTSTVFVGQAGGTINGNLANGESGLAKNAGTPLPNEWWANKSDHTGNPNGLMMLVDAPLTLNTVFVEYTMNNLCPNTTLHLSIWILNTNSSGVVAIPNYKYPNMMLKVLNATTGAVLGTAATGNVPADTNWHEYTLDFNNGNDSSVKLQLVNNVSGANVGNDLAIDDITVSPCIPSTIQAVPNASTSLCANQNSTVNFTATLTGSSYNPAEYQWQLSNNNGTTWLDEGVPTTNPNYTFSSAGRGAGNYSIRFKVGPQGSSLNTQCNAVSQVAVVTITNPPTVTDAVIRECFVVSNPSTASFNLTAANVTSEAGVTRRYFPSLTDATNGTNEILNNLNSYIAPNGVVYIRITNTNGCFSVAKVSLEVIPPKTSPVLVDKIICIEETTTLDAGPGFNAYEWSTGATTQQIDNVNVGTYWVNLKSGNCVTKQTVTVYPSSQPVIQSIEINNNIAIIHVTGGNPSYQFSIDNAAVWQNSNTFTNLTRGQHTFHVKDAYNCDPISVEVTVANLVNTITPNGDGKNDSIDYSALAYKNNLIFEIYDRYGNRLYQADKIRNFKWDGTSFGKKVPTATYWYIISWNENDKKATPIQYKGWVLVKNRE
ncbi:T9SS type B sorting domain-containing protein [Chryseobacterium sp. Bi04]|uniref:T9SS type B sorting domain-containing protein n=1 Tax=Chryseobacterium sp. Bi04 TaxID=2822345 RepID=UPI001DC7AE86|nr:T9SS type B sorting domain-containing protein [Chryseobacterium sp. Bi04]CAH0268841.1 hypothetical protein SRABI04_03703 [Chryseobacterium sp. Bi04]